MFGSRTEVDMSDFTFEDLVLGSVRTTGFAAALSCQAAADLGQLHRRSACA